MKLRERYDQLKSKYNLPGYDELNMGFDIEEISAESGVILQKIRNKMHEKIEGCSVLIESTIQPDTTLKDMYEAKYLSDKEREDAYVLFKKLVHIIKSSNLVSVSNTEEKNADFIKESFAEWGSLKKDIELHLKRSKDIWKKETDIKSDLSYFG